MHGSFVATLPVHCPPGLPDVHLLLLRHCFWIPEIGLQLFCPKHKHKPIIHVYRSDQHASSLLFDLLVLFFFVTPIHNNSRENPLATDRRPGVAGFSRRLLFLDLALSFLLRMELRGHFDVLAMLPHAP
jgi:hypothetical protein